MAIRYRYDLYPRDNPRDGARLVRFTKLQQASYRDVVGVGSGAFTIRSTESEADFLDPDGEQYVRVVREDTGDASALTVGGFWINKYHHKTADRNLTKRLVASGAGTMAYLARARMAPHSYLSEFHAFASGSDPYDDMWRLYAQGVFAGGDFLGAVLWRVLMEASHFRSGATYTHVHKDGILYDDSHDDDRTESALPDMVLDFDQDVDSNGNAWTVPSGEFTAQVGETVLSVVQRLMNAGLYVRMDPDTFVVSAYEEEEHRRDRTGSSWGTNVVRFQSPTDTTVDTGNMLSESERELESSVKRSLIWAGGQDSYEKATQASDVPWEGFEASDVADSAALSQIASRQLSARNESADKPKIRIKMGRSPTTGRYLPWEEVRIEDLVTVHTGTGKWDHDESTYPVAALRIELQRSGAWHGWAELGDSFGSAQSKTFSTATVGAHKHPPNPELCRIGSAQVPVLEDTIFDITDGASLHPDYNYAGGDHTFIAFTWGSNNDLSQVPTWMYNLNGTGPDLEQSFVAVDNSSSPAIWILNNPNASVGSGTEFRLDDGTNNDGFLLAVFVVHGLFDAGDLRDWARNNGSGTSSSVTVDAEANDLILDFAEYDQNNLPGFVIDPTAGQTEVNGGNINQAFGQRDVAAAMGSKVAVSGGSQAVTWGNFSASGPWDAAAVVVAGVTVIGDVPFDTVHQGEESTGTSVRAARCDHEHAHGLLSTSETHYHDADHIEDLPSVPEDLGDLTDVTITAPVADDTLRYVDGEWINDNRRWEAVTDGEDVFVWEGDDLVHEWNGAY